MMSLSAKLSFHLPFRLAWIFSEALKPDDKLLPRGLSIGYKVSGEGLEVYIEYGLDIGSFAYALDDILMHIAMLENLFAKLGIDLSKSL
ncbi:MAG: KEOPS complex subunit Pcc1 [Nitrososphaerota archaeon]|nr:KEOPS complex subunit Pcc1 [Candidatus Bathyarchaeota archaeon]MCX8162377.1 KEOPS complex subunit Pcc1 [Candidatus Bathyarchaeota archaeon]MDW8061169.1 KEOPS complex subunit Pcc1 [Nitrososphaerota archaeon]